MKPEKRLLPLFLIAFALSPFLIVNIIENIIMNNDMTVFVKVITVILHLYICFSVSLYLCGIVFSLFARSMVYSNIVALVYSNERLSKVCIYFIAAAILYFTALLELSDLLPLVAVIVSSFSSINSVQIFSAQGQFWHIDSTGFRLRRIVAYSGEAKKITVYLETGKEVFLFLDKLPRTYKGLWDILASSSLERKT